MVYIIKGMHASFKLQEVLKSVGKRMLSFPNVELRQDTWRRFSNLYELVNYYPIHVNLDRVVKRRYEYNLGKTNVGTGSLIVEGSTEDTKGLEFKILEEAQTMTLNLKFKLQQAINKKYKPVDLGDSDLYKTVLTNLHAISRTDIVTVRALRERVSLRSMLGFIVNLTRLSLLFFEDIPENYLIRKTRSSKLIIPAEAPVEVLLSRLNGLSKTVDDDYFKCEEFVNKIRGCLGSPKDALEEIKKAHEWAYTVMEDTYEKTGMNATYYQGGREYGAVNFNSYLNIILLDDLYEALIITINTLTKLSGASEDEYSIKVLTPTIEGVVELATNKRIFDIIKYENIKDYIQKVFYTKLSDKGIKGEEFKALNTLVNNTAEPNIELYNKLRREILNYFEFNDKVYLRGLVESSLVTPAFERDLRELSGRFQNHAMRTHSLLEEYMMQFNIDMLLTMRISADSNIIGNNGIPLMVYAGEKNRYWIYSSHNLKTLYPSTNNEIIPMGEYDWNKVMQFRGEGGD